MRIRRRRAPLQLAMPLMIARWRRGESAAQSWPSQTWSTISSMHEVIDTPFECVLGR